MSESNAFAVLLPIMIILLLFTSFFSASETAITSINIIRLKQIAKGKDSSSKKSEIRQAKRVYRFVKEYDRTLLTILLANTLINTALATVGALFFTILIVNKSTSTWVSTIAMGFIILIFGEVIPKTLAKRMPEKFSIWASYPLQFFKFILWPFTWIMTIIHSNSDKPSTTENELIELIATIEAEGVIETNEKELIESAITFDEKKVFDVMTGIEKVIYIYEDIKWNELRTLYINEKFTRVPVVSRNNGYVIGLLNFKDVLLKMLENKRFVLKEVLTPCLFIHQNMKLDDALEYLQQEQIHMAIVTPRKDTKKLVGIVTLEDLLEELVGEIYDEDDETGSIKEIGHHKFWVYGNTPLKKLFKKQLMLNVSNQDYNKNLYEWFVDKTGFMPNDPNSVKKIIYKNYCIEIKLDQKHSNNKSKSFLFEIEKLSNNNHDADLLK